MPDLDDLVTLLDELGPVLLSSDDSTGLLALCSTAALALGASACSIAVLDEADGALLYVGASGAGADAIIGTRLPLGRGIAGYVASSGQSLWVSDVRADARFSSDVAEATGYVPTSLVAVPIDGSSGPIGVLSLLDPERAELAVAASFGALAGVTLSAAMVAVSMGRAVVGVLADRADEADNSTLADALRSAAVASAGPSADLAEIAALFSELGALSESERAAATRIVAQFTAHAAGSRPPQFRRRGRE